MEIHKDNGCYHETSFVDENGNLRTIKIPVVQELARGGLDRLPERFKRCAGPGPSPNPLVQAHQIGLALEEVPVIDLGVLKEGARAAELGRLAVAARGVGAFAVVGEGVPGEAAGAAREAVRGFFEMGYEEKRESVGSYGDVDNMGYGRNYVKCEDQRLDWIDRLTVRAVPPVDDGLRVWPLKPPNFREAMERYVEEARALMDFLLVALAEALSLQNYHAFLQYFHPQHSEIKVRVNYYPPCPEPHLALGLNQHSDPSALTLLTQFGSSRGLQVFTKDRTTWLTLAWPQDHMLVIIGDLLEIMSNGIVQSAWHRVVTHKDEERGSIALFYSPPPKTLIQPVDIAEDEKGGGRGYKEVVVEDYVRHYYRVSPTMDKVAIDFAKLKY